MNRKIGHSISSAAKKLGIGRDLCSQAVEKGQIPSIEVGKRKLITDATLKELLQGRWPTSNNSGKAA